MKKRCRQKLELYKDALQAGREVICSSKIKLGYGTDFVANHQNYESGYEFMAWMNSGMDPFRALMAATRINAEILGLQSEIGSVEPGKSADISARLLAPHIPNNQKNGVWKSVEIPFSSFSMYFVEISS